MSRLAPGAVCVAAAAAALAALAGSSLAVADGGPTRTQLKLLGRLPAKFGQIDQEPKGDSPGDYFTNSGTLYRGSKRVGTFDAICFTTWAHKRVICQSTLTLPDGKIVAAAAENAASKTNTDPIIGGTGVYADARGTITAVDLSNGVDITVDVARS